MTQDAVKVIDSKVDEIKKEARVKQARIEELSAEINRIIEPQEAVLDLKVKNNIEIIKSIGITFEPWSLHLKIAPKYVELYKSKLKSEISIPSPVSITKKKEVEVSAKDEYACLAQELLADIDEQKGKDITELDSRVKKDAPLDLNLHNPSDRELAKRMGLDFEPQFLKLTITPKYINLHRKKLEGEVSVLESSIAAQKKSLFSTEGYALYHARQLVTEEKVVAIFKIENKEERVKQLRELLDNAFTGLSSTPEIEAFTLEAAVIITKVHYHKFAEVWLKDLTPRQKALEKIFDIKYTNGGLNLFGVQIMGQSLIETIKLLPEISLTDVFALSDVLLGEDNRPTMEGKYLSVLRDAYQRHYFGKEIDQLKARADAATKLLEKQSETIKAAEKLLLQTKSEMEIKVVNELKQQGCDFKELHGVVDEINAYNQQIGSITSELNRLTSSDADRSEVQKTFGENQVRLETISKELEIKLEKMTALVGAASNYFLQRLDACEKLAAKLKAKIADDEKPVNDIQEQIKTTQTELESFNIECAKILEKNQQDQQGIKEQQAFLVVKQKESDEAQVNFEQQRGHVENIENSLKQLEYSLNTLKAKEEVPLEVNAIILGLNTNQQELIKTRDQEVQKLQELSANVDQKKSEVESLKEEIARAEDAIKPDNNSELKAYEATQTEKVERLNARIADLSKQLEVEKAKKYKEKHQTELTVLQNEIDELGILLSMVLNLSPAQKDSVTTLRLAKDTINAQIQNEVDIKEVESQIGDISKELVIASPTTLRGEVESAISQLKTEGEELIKRSEEARAGIVQAAGEFVVEVQEKTKQLQAITQQNAQKTTEALKIIQTIDERNTQILSAAERMFGNLSTLLTDVEKIKELNADAQYALAHPCVVQLEKAELEKVKRLLVVLQYLQNEKQSLKDRGRSEGDTSFDLTTSKIENLQSLILSLMVTFDSIKRNNILINCELILRDRRTAYSDYWIIGSIIDWFLRGKATVSSEMYGKLRQKALKNETKVPESMEKYFELYNNLLNNNSSYYNAFRQVMIDSKKSEELLAKGGENREKCLIICKNKLKDISELKDQIDILKTELSSVLPLGKEYLDKSTADKVKTTVDIRFDELKLLETKLLNLENSFHNFTKKISEHDSIDYFIFEQERLDVEGSKIISDLTQIVDESKRIKQKVDTEKVSFEKMLASPKEGKRKAVVLQVKEKESKKEDTKRVGAEDTSLVKIKTLSQKASDGNENAENELTVGKNKQLSARFF
jgi:hypothetical protein